MSAEVFKTFKSKNTADFFVVQMGAVFLLYKWEPRSPFVQFCFSLIGDQRGMIAAITRLISLLSNKRSNKPDQEDIL